MRRPTPGAFGRCDADLARIEQRHDPEHGGAVLGILQQASIEKAGFDQLSDFGLAHGVLLLRASWGASPSLTRRVGLGQKRAPREHSPRYVFDPPNSDGQMTENLPAAAFDSMRAPASRAAASRQGRVGSIS